MSNTGSPEEYRAELVKAMGEDLGGLLFELDNRFCQGCLKWQQHEELFDTREKVDLLNESAPAFFASLQHILVDDVVMHISRLTDKKKVAGKDTLSLDQMQNAITDPALKTKVAPLLADVATKTQSARDYRNKHGAHTSLDVVRGDEVVPGVTRAEVKAALGAIHNVFNTIKEHFGIAPSCLEVIGALGGVPNLLAILKRGLEARKEERERWRRQ